MTSPFPSLYPFRRPQTLVDLLRIRASDAPDQVGYIYLKDGEQDEVSITYGELDRQARAIASWLEEHRAANERVLLLYPPGLEYIVAYFGCLYAGAVAVPAYPPRLNRPTPRIQGIVADCGARFALTTTDILANLEQRFDQTPDLQHLQWLDTLRTPSPGLETSWREPMITPDTLAFLQYTSGSTSQPKGVMVSHANLLHNMQQIWLGFGLAAYDGESIPGCSWLPTYHDMGLIGGILESMYACVKMVIMSPLAFLQRPVRWLQAISHYKVAVSGGPNFAYDLCIDKVKPESVESLDLSNWRIAFCGAEPIRIDTLTRFAQKFASTGFRLEAFYPCYGLAEATLFVSGSDGSRLVKTINVQREALETGQVKPVAKDEQESITLVSCGKAFLDQQIVIVNPYSLIRCPANQVGEIWISGGSVAGGYWGRLEESQRVFQAFIAGTGDGPYLRTGDLGFILDGELYVTGRLKDLIIIRGSNHYPQDIELTVETCHPALEPSSGAAFSVTVDGEEQLVVVQEVNRHSRNQALGDTIRAIRTAISENHDLQVYAIILIRPLTIPKTSSGKIQRHATKAAYLDGTLEVLEAWQFRS